MLSGRLMDARLRRFLGAYATALLTIALAFALGAGPARAQVDNFLNGDGHDGAVTWGNATYVPNAVAPVSGAVSAGATSLTRGTIRAGSGTGNVTFANNRLVMIAQMTGWTGTATSGSQTATDITSSQVGKYEFARISTVAGSTLNFTSALVNSFDAGSTQVIAVPEYTNVTVNNANARVNAQTWDGTSGGILSVFASGTVSFTAAGWFSADARGFRGGVSYVESTSSNLNCDEFDGNTAGGEPSGMKGEGIYPSAFDSASPPNALSQEGRGNYLNAGAGGNCFNASGGGGANGGAGGKGGYTLTPYDGGRDVGGLGGHALTYQPYNQLSFGGGGGAGDRNNANPGTGGAGGGVVYVRGGTLTGSGIFRSNGANGVAGNAVSTPYDGSGGGGAGGVVSLRFVNGLACGSAIANGGAGGNNAANGGNTWSPGAGGGGGKVYLQGSSVSCTTTTATGGANGTSSGGAAYGATAGGAGTTASTLTGMSTPTATLSAPANGSYVSTTTPTVSGTSTANATIYVYVDGALSGTATADGSGNWSYVSPALSQAGHTVYVRPEYLGLSGSNTATNSFTVDATAPTVSISAPANGSYTADNTPATAFSVTETNPNVTECRVDGGSWAACTSGSSLAALTDGSHTFDVRHTDDAGNVGSASSTFTVDTVNPVVSISAPANGSYTADNTPTITFSVTETNQNTTECRVDGGSWAACTSGSSLAALADGSHTLDVRHTDDAGNVGTDSTTFTVDATAPTVSISAGRQHAHDHLRRHRNESRCHRVPCRRRQLGSVYLRQQPRGAGRRQPYARRPPHRRRRQRRQRQLDVHHRHHDARCLDQRPGQRIADRRQHAHDHLQRHRDESEHDRVPRRRRQLGGVHFWQQPRGAN
ncbi:MAG: hypothetical protein HZB14_08900 [Actinobacteria bacterium]|nr:hypothetical protein [Actinomycetota bacterium]